MRAYAYTAYDTNGRSTRGTVVAETETDATSQLKARGLYVADLTTRGGAGSQTGIRLRRTRLNGDMQAVFTRQMAVLIGAGLSAEAALRAVRTSGDRQLDGVAARALAVLMDGAALSEALETSGAGFPPYVIASIRAGEAAGDAAAVFGELADHLETLGSDKAQISTALIYPAFVAAVSLLVCGILMTTVAPEIVAMFELSGNPLPPLTQTMLTITDWTRDHALWVTLGLVGLVALGFATSWVPRLRIARDGVLLRLPVAGSLMRRGAAVQYLRTMALVLASRNTVPVAVQSAAGVLDVAQFRREADTVDAALTRGETLSTALEAVSIIPPVARQLIRAGEASARLAHMTDRAAVMVENGLSTERKRIAALLEPLLMMLVGAFVLIIVLAVLLPIFELQSVVG